MGKKTVKTQEGEVAKVAKPATGTDASAVKAASSAKRKARHVQEGNTQR